jgi:hypothetical protein
VCSDASSIIWVMWKMTVLYTVLWAVSQSKISPSYPLIPSLLAPMLVILQ